MSGAGGAAKPQEKGNAGAPGGALFAFLVDREGSVLAAFGPGRLPTPASQLPQQAALEGSRLARGGFLHPRSAVTRSLIGGYLLCVEGDSILLCQLFDREPTEVDERLGLAAVRSLEEAHPAQLTTPVPSRSPQASAFSATLRKAMLDPSARRGDQPPWPEVFVRPVLGTRGGSLTLNLQIRNYTSTPARGVEVRVSSPRGYLKPAALYGDGAILGGDIVRLLEPLAPGEKPLTLNFLPFEPRSGPLNVTLRYAGPDGRQREVAARQLNVAIAAPKLEAPEVAAPQFLSATLRRRELVHDGWRLYLRPHVQAHFAFERVKEAVERERPLKLLEHAVVSPAYFEAWYFARVVGSRSPVVIEASVNARARVLEIRAATERPEDLLGLMAEYRHRMSELLSERLMGHGKRTSRLESLTRRSEEELPELHAVLLLRHLEGEISAQELGEELRRSLLREGDDALALLEAFEEGEPEDVEEGKPGVPRPPRISGKSADFEVLPGLSDGWRRLIAPGVLGLQLEAPAPVSRKRQQYDRSGESEISAVDTVL